MTRSRDVADTQDNLGGAVAPYVAGKNPIINGGFDIWQRGTSIAVPAAAGFTYTTDRFGASTGSNQAITISRQSVSDSVNLPDIQYCARVQRNSGQTGTGSYFFDTPIETANSIPLIGKTITLSFYVRGGASFVSAGDGFAGQIIAAAGIDQNPGNWTSPVLAAQRTATLTTTWQRFTVSTTVTSSYTQLFLRFNHTPIGTAGASDYYEITGIQLELGSVATPFARAGGSIGGELALCQRYYEKSYNVDVAPGASTDNGQSVWTFVGSTITGTMFGYRSFAVIKRAAPTVTLYDPVGNVNKVRRTATGVANYDNISANVDGSYNNGIFVNCPSSASATNAMTGHWVANAEL